jgi:hypothetical protein
MKSHYAARGVSIVVILVLAAISRLEAQDSPNRTPGQGTGEAAQQSPKEKAAAPNGVAEVIRMLDAKVSPEVIKTYVESAPVGFNAGATDLIALKEHGATDDISTAVLKRSAEVRTRASQVQAEVKAQASTRVDPESYEFFTSHYLYPRTIESINDRLGVYPLYPYSSSYYYPVAPFGARSVGFSQPGRFGLGVNRGSFLPSRIR